MDINERLDLYKEMYYYEFQHRDSITEHISWSLGIVAALGAGLLYLINRAPPVAWQPVEFVYLISTGLSIFFWVMAVMYMAQAWWGLDYGYLTSPSKLERWILDLEKHKSEHAEAPEVQDTFRKGVLQTLCEITEANRLSNRRKSWKHHVCKRWLLATAVGIAVAFVSDYLLREEITGTGTQTEVQDERETVSTPAPSAPSAAAGLFQGGE